VLIPIQFELAQNEPWWNKGLKPLVQRNFIENWYKEISKEKFTLE
jgi:hypothetical protein